MDKSLSQLTIKLKNDLIRANDNTYTNNDLWLSIEDIHKIRIGIQHIKNAPFNKIKCTPCQGHDKKG